MKNKIKTAVLRNTHCCYRFVYVFTMCTTYLYIIMILLVTCIFNFVLFAVIGNCIVYMDCYGFAFGNVINVKLPHLEYGH